MLTQTIQHLNNCRDFADAGLCLIPLRLDGSKAPAIPSWKPYQDRKPTAIEIDKWFSQPAGVAIVCGAVSGLEVLDFDYEAEKIFPTFSAMVDSILIRLPVVETPGGGCHVYFRCSAICGSKKIAMRDGKTLIESKGERGLITTVLNPPEVHELHYEYIQVDGPVLPEIPTITPAERMELWRAASSFDMSRVIDKRVKNKQVNRRSAARFNSGNVESARKYIDKMDPAISGFNGHGQTYKVACRLIQTFRLTNEQALVLLLEFNERCEPQWTRRDLEHKVREACKV